MKKLLLVCCIILNTAILFAQVPSWLNNKNEYPTDLYISAIGEGKTKKAAENDCLATLSKYFKTSVKNTSSAIKTLQAIEENGNSDFKSNKNISQEIEVRSDAELFGINFLPGYYDKKVKRYYCFGYIDKNKTLQVYDSKITFIMTFVDNLFAKKENDLFITYSKIRKALLLTQIAEVYIDNSIVLNPTTITKNKIYLDEIAKLKSKLNLMQKDMIFSIKCSTKDGETITPVIASILEDCGFKYSPKNSNYIIQYSLTFTEGKTEEAGVFVKPAIMINVSDKNNNTIFSYSKAHPRYIHRDFTNAKSLALTRIQQDLEENFFIEFRE